ncbi:hypothetical protein Y032_0273g977 [Ancylostoma ceylanicum]|uniref:Uncharacterized protein n=1 Tax=Ancylostoma ceylanicum TaxID=53326 RepID=A0A016S8H4_9BILA|nr:hypothetical protein Y032_0273g977 [Ancylostoma ceylanicum]
MLESGTTVFSPSKKKDIYALGKVQNNFTRKLLARIGGFLYSKIPRATIRNAYFGLPSLESRRRLFDVCMVHKLLHSPASWQSSTFFKLIPSRTRGGCHKPSYMRARTKLRNNVFAIRAVAAYLKLTKDVVISPSFSRFKRIMSAKILGPLVTKLCLVHFYF